MAKTVFILSLLFLSAIFSGCGEPCETLAGKICDCTYEVRYDKESCKRTYIELNNRDFSEKQSDKCDALLDLCSCDDLKEDGNQARCGLANLYE